MFANTIGSGFEDHIDLFFNNVCFPALERFRWEPDGQDWRPEPSLGSNAILSFLKRSFCPLRDFIHTNTFLYEIVSILKEVPSLQRLELSPPSQQSYVGKTADR
jgi:hypothetical protein